VAVDFCDWQDSPPFGYRVKLVKTAIEVPNICDDDDGSQGVSTPTSLVQCRARFIIERVDFF
jgi:hypothetical protein